MLAKGRYLGLIRSGRKTTTVRLSPGIRPGQLFTFTDCRDSVRVRCLDVRDLAVRALTDVDAQRDGFADLDDLLAALRQHYPHLTAWTRVFVVAFTLEESDSAHRARATPTSGQLFPE